MTATHSRTARTTGRASQALREEILSCCRESVRVGLSFSTQGNISVRLPGAHDGADAIVLTPSEVRSDAMSIDDRVAVAVEENAEVLHRACVAGSPRVLVDADIDVPEGARLP